MTPFQVIYDPTLGCYFLAIVGHITAGDSAEMITHINRDPNFFKATCFLVDMRSTTYDIDATGQEHVAAIMSAEQAAHRQRIPRALVVSAGITIGVVRRWQAITNTATTSRVFHNMEEARAWLGLPKLLPEII